MSISSSSSLGGTTGEAVVAVAAAGGGAVTVEEPVMVRSRSLSSPCFHSGPLVLGEVGGVPVFFWPKEKVWPADLKKLLDEGDFRMGGTGTSAYGFLEEEEAATAAAAAAAGTGLVSSYKSTVDEGGVDDVSLRRDELSVDTVLVVLDDPLPLSAPMSA
jgi:hypothetical protein